MSGQRRPSPLAIAVVVTVFVLLMATPSVVRGDLFTAVVDLEKLLFTEGEVLRSLSEYVGIEEKRLALLKEHIVTWEGIHQVAIQDSEKFVSNPVNAFLLIKRLSSDWKYVRSMLIKDNGRALRNITKTRKDLQFPKDEDLSGAAMALTRLQNTYRLTTSSLVRGEIQGVQYTAELKASDCFELGRESYRNGDHYHTVMWLQEAMDRYETQIIKFVDKAYILDYLAYSTFKQGNVRQALKLTHDLLELEPENQRAQRNIKYYETVIAQTHNEKSGKEKLPTAATPSSNKEQSDNEIYEKLCRGEKMLEKKVESSLKCRYVTNGNPYLLIQPVKQEEAFKQPRIFIYHDVLFESQIAAIKKIATPELKRSTVQHFVTGKRQNADYRISKSAKLKKEDFDVVKRVTKRIGEITGLEMATSEDLHVVNYGIGGQYEPHYDFATSEVKIPFKHLGTGNRIATFLGYLSDVSAGGATVFPRLGVTLWPKKGSAAFWYNLYRSGDGDLLTKHGGCPVLVGSKWVSNTWFHERGQEFRRKCGLTRFAA